MGVMDLRRNIALNEPHVATKTGNPASFSTDMKGLLKQAKAAFSPVQSGTGDPSPENVRPITGRTGVTVNHSGKNICDIVGYSSSDINGIDPTTFTLSNSYGTTISTTVFNAPDTSLVVTQSSSTTDYAKSNYRNGYFDVVPKNLEFGKTYTLSFKVTNIVSNPLEASLSDILIVRPSGNTATVTVSGNIVLCTFINYQNSSAPNRRIISIRNCGMSFTMSEFMVTVEGETDRTFAPYSGTTYPVTFPAQGKNLLGATGRELVAVKPTTFSNATKRTFAEGTYVKGLTANNYCQTSVSITGISISEGSLAFTTESRGYGLGFPLFGLVPGTKYTISATTTGTLSASFYQEDGTYISNVAGSSSHYGYTTFEIPQGTYCTVICFSGRTDGVEATFTDVMLATGETPVSYEPYTNTAYGGTLDLITGTLTVTHKKTQLKAWGMSGTWDSQTNSGAFWYASGIQILEDTNAGVMCNRLATRNQVTQADNTNRITWYANGILRWIEIGTMEMDKTEYNAYLDENPLEATYKLATPIVYQLTPQQITALIGDNVLWSDTNEDCTVQYWKH